MVFMKAKPLPVRTYRCWHCGEKYKSELLRLPEDVCWTPECVRARERANDEIDAIELARAIQESEDENG